MAALYTARDLEVDVAILHGPSGCSFKHARLLEEDGMRVLTTALADNEFIFGGQKPLEEVLRYAEDHFAPKKMAVIGTCVSMIIGEDLAPAIDSAGITTSTIAVDIHAGFPENIAGVLATLDAAKEAGWIAEDELVRQHRLMEKANEVEKIRGAASQAYIEPSRGNLKHVAAQRLIECAKSGAKGVAILNAKSIPRTCSPTNSSHSTMPAPVRISRTSQTSITGACPGPGGCQRIRDEMTKRGVPLEVIRALDEYGGNGDALGARIRELAPQFAFIVGVPHAIPLYTRRDRVLLGDKPRQVAPLHAIGHQHVLVEIDLHPKTLGVRDIVESEFAR